MANPTPDSYSLASGSRLYAGLQAPPSSEPVLTNKYRFQQPLLFQRAHAKSMIMEYTNSLGQQMSYPSRVVYFNGQGGVNIPPAGPTRDRLCPLSNWFWANPNTGDWIDSAGTPQGTVPFSTSSTLPGLAPAGTLSIDVTAALTRCYELQRWIALYLRVVGGGVYNIPGALNTTTAKPTIAVNYSDGTSETLQLWVAASIRSSTGTTNALDDLVQTFSTAPLVMEFFRPADQNKIITSATLSLPHGGGLTSSSGTFQVYLVNPPLPTSTTPEAGIAASYSLDSGIDSNPAVAISVRVNSSSTTADHVVQDLGWVAESGFDPTLWDPAATPTETQLNALYPRKNFGKLIGRTNNGVRAVRPDDAQALSRGFSPLAPGMGAIEFYMPGRNIKQGQAWFDSGEVGSETRLFLPRNRIGQVTDGYMRYYLLLGSGWEPKNDDFRLHFTAPSAHVGKYPEEYGGDPMTLAVRPTDLTGKFPGGLQAPTYGVRWKHYNPATRVGDPSPTNVVVAGNYGVTSGLAGYQGRMAFSQGLWREDLPGPVVGGASMLLELYDFAESTHSIPSQRHIQGWDASGKSGAGQRGGIGHLYPFRWYCVEMRWKLNSITEYNLPPIGTDYREAGFLVDGFIEFWIDGIKAARSENFATRSGLLVDWAWQNANGAPLGSSSNTRRPITNVPLANYNGFSEMIFNPYYGGRSPNPRDKYIYINGIVVSTSYIGPMGGLSRANGGMGS